MGKKDASTTKLPVDQYRKQIGEWFVFISVAIKNEQANHVN